MSSTRSWDARSIWRPSDCRSCSTDRSPWTSSRASRSGSTTVGPMTRARRGRGRRGRWPFGRPSATPKWGPTRRKSHSAGRAWPSRTQRRAAHTPPRSRRRWSAGRRNGEYSCSAFGPTSPAGDSRSGSSLKSRSAPESSSVWRHCCAGWATTGSSSRPRTCSFRSPSREGSSSISDAWC